VEKIYRQIDTEFSGKKRKAFKKKQFNTKLDLLEQRHPE